MKTYPADWDHVVSLFSDAMRSKMAMHVDKGDWRNVHVGDVLEKLSEELAELRDAVARGNSVEVLLEAADVGVCAMIIADLHLGCPRPKALRDADVLRSIQMAAPPDPKSPERGPLDETDGQVSRMFDLGARDAL